jgi:nucleoside-diphosphate-sugar epimerase
MSQNDIFIIGHSGFIGKALYEKINKKNKIYLISKKKSFNLKNEFCHDVFTDFRWFKLLKNNSTIFFLAFNNDLYELEKNESYIKKIEKFSNNFNKYIEDKKIFVNFIFTSTVTIYGNTNSRKLVNEKHKDNPKSNYDRAKLALENIFFKYEKKNNLNFVSLRLSNIYGVNLFNSQINRGFMNKLIINIYKKKKIIIFGKGNNLRNYLYIDDLINALVLSKKKIKDISGKIIIVCNNKSISFNNIIKIVSKTLNTSTEIKKTPYPNNINQIEKRSFRGSNLLLKKYIGWKPKINMNSGIKKIIKAVKIYEHNN